MTTVAYLAYGRRRLIKESVFSALTFLHVASTLPATDWQLVVYTDAPDLFRRVGIAAHFFPIDCVAHREDASGFNHRRKLLIIEHCAETFDGDLLYVDGDTYFTSSPIVLFDALAAGRTILHTREWVLSPETQPKLYRLIHEHVFHSPMLRAAQKQHQLWMWNAGVIGLPEDHKALLTEIIAATDELYTLYRYHAMEQFAWSLFFQQISEIVPADETVYHYWYGRDELTHRTTSFLRSHRGLSLTDLAGHAYALQPKISAEWSPPLEVRARRIAGATRRGVRRMLAKAHG